jgi:hypothetical protein
VRQDLAALRERHAALGAEHNATIEARADLQAQLDRQTARIRELETAIAEQRRAAEQAALEFADRLRAADDVAQARIRPLMVELDGYRTHEREWKQQRIEAERRQFESLELLARTKCERHALQSTNDRLMQQIGPLSHSLATAEQAARSAGLSVTAKAAIAKAYLATADGELLSCWTGRTSRISPRMPVRRAGTRRYRLSRPATNTAGTAPNATGTATRRTRHWKRSRLSPSQSIPDGLRSRIPRNLRRRRRRCSDRAPAH